MGHYDDDTKKFMEDVSGESPAEIGVKKVLSVASAIAQKKSPSQLIAKEIVKNIVKQANVSPLAVYQELNGRFGKEWWDWAPETLWAMIEGYDLTPEFKSLIQSFQVIVRTDYPLEHWHIFEKVGHALNFNHVDFGMLQPLSPEEIAFTLYCLKKLRPGAELQDEVHGYIAACAREAGVAYLPPELFTPDCQSYLDQFNFDQELTRKVKEAWDEDQKATDQDVQNQLDMLHEIREYIAGLAL